MAGIMSITLDLPTALMFLFAVFNIVLIGPMTWILKTAIKDLRDVEEDMTSFQKEVYLTFVRRDEYKNDIDEIKELIRGLDNKFERNKDRLVGGG